MKTTVELPDELLDKVRETARREGLTMREMMEEGLQRSLEARRTARARTLEFPVFGGSGLTDEFRDAGWQRLRDEIYRGHGGG